MHGSNKKLELRVIAPTAAEKNGFSKHVDMVVMYASTGYMGILPGRALVSVVLAPGLLRFFEGEAETQMPIGGGIAHVSGDVVTVLTEFITAK